VFKIKVKEDDDKKGKIHIFSFEFRFIAYTTRAEVSSTFMNISTERETSYTFLYTKYYNKQHGLLAFLVSFFFIEISF